MVNQFCVIHQGETVLRTSLCFILETNSQAYWVLETVFFLFAQTQTLQRGVEKAQSNWPEVRRATHLNVRCHPHCTDNKTSKCTMRNGAMFDPSDFSPFQGIKAYVTMFVVMERGGACTENTCNSET